MGDKDGMLLTGADVPVVGADLVGEAVIVREGLEAGCEEGIAEGAIVGACVGSDTMTEITRMATTLFPKPSSITILSLVNAS